MTFCGNNDTIKFGDNSTAITHCILEFGEAADLNFISSLTENGTACLFNFANF